jgi:hypothetical protein
MHIRTYVAGPPIEDRRAVGISCEPCPVALIPPLSFLMFHFRNILSLCEGVRFRFLPKLESVIRDLNEAAPSGLSMVLASGHARCVLCFT